MINIKAFCVLAICLAVSPWALAASVREESASMDANIATTTRDTGGQNIDSNWPHEAFDGVCKSVIECMCKLVPEGDMTYKMKRLCSGFEKISDDACEKSAETIVFRNWWEGEESPDAYNVAHDCIPSMFEEYDWKVQ